MNFKDLIKISKVSKMKWCDHHIHNDVGGGIYRMSNDKKKNSSMWGNPLICTGDCMNTMERKETHNISLMKL